MCCKISNERCQFNSTSNNLIFTISKLNFIFKLKVINGLLKYWPKTNSIKEALFLKEVFEILNFVDPFEFQIVLIPLFKKLAGCISSPCLKVFYLKKFTLEIVQAFFFFCIKIAEYTSSILKSESILDIINANQCKILPIILSSLINEKRTHWNEYGLVIFNIDNRKKIFFNKKAQ